MESRPPLRGLLQRISAPERSAAAEAPVARGLHSAHAAMHTFITPSLTGVERVLEDDDIIVSKTDPQGRIVYANDTFLRVSGYTEAELLGAPHSVLRHPAMPRSVFALLWQRLEAGKEIYAVVLNRSKNGDHYWVHAHVTPSLSPSGVLRGHHSFRRKCPLSTVAAAERLYAEVLAVESREATKAGQVRAGIEAMLASFGDLGPSYDRFLWKAAP
jgi:PAS domain S-box-containing protein